MISLSIFEFVMIMLACVVFGILISVGVCLSALAVSIKTMIKTVCELVKKEDK